MNKGLVVFLIILCCCISAIGGFLYMKKRKANQEAKKKLEETPIVVSDSEDEEEEEEELAPVVAEKPREEPKTYSLRDAQTQANDWGGGNSIFLDRHTLDCGDDGINQFKLGRPKGNQIQYSYKCVEGINSPANINKDTGANDWGGGNTIFLDRHNVNCGENPISKFRLVRPRPNQIRYDYTCNSAKIKGQCRDSNTGWNQESNMHIYLDRHNVKCEDDEVITQFKLNRDGKGKFRYDYKCCQL